MNRYSKKKGIQLHIVVWLMAVFIVVVTSVLATMDQHDAEVEFSNYCEMVGMHRASSGQVGWPDYRKLYDTECVPSPGLQAPRQPIN